MKRFKEYIREAEIAANAMGTSSSTPGTGAIDTYDPLLLKTRIKKRLLRRRRPQKLAREAPRT